MKKRELLERIEALGGEVNKLAELLVRVSKTTIDIEDSTTEAWKMTTALSEKIAKLNPLGVDIKSLNSQVTNLHVGFKNHVEHHGRMIAQIEQHINAKLIETIDEFVRYPLMGLSDDEKAIIARKLKDEDFQPSDMLNEPAPKVKKIQELWADPDCKAIMLEKRRATINARKANQVPALDGGKNKPRRGRPKKVVAAS